jgi:pimeloyl-ACP methyl ester carboxylesterase
MQTATIHGIEMGYRDEGDGVPLVLVHGFPLSGAMWQPQISALSARYRVIAPDLRGFGASTFGGGADSLDQYADDLLALLDHLDVRKVALAGLSMGGYIAFALLRRAADRVSALVLADTKAAADSDEARQKREQNARMVETSGLAPLAEQMLPGLLADRTPQGQQQAVRGIIMANQPEGIAAALRAMAQRPDSTPQLSAINVPTLIMVGSEDTLTPPGEARKLHEAIKGSQFVELSGAAHLSNIEAPAAFNAAVDSFLGGNSTRAYGAGSQSSGRW